MEVLTLGGLAKPMRSTTTGEAQSLEFRSVPVVLSATAQIPNTTATVMQTTSNGECQGVQPPWVFWSNGFIEGRSGKVLEWKDNRWEMWGASSVDKRQENPDTTKAEWGQCDKGLHLEADWHIIDVIIFHCEKKIVSHVGSTDLHYNMFPARMEVTARAECKVQVPERGKREGKHLAKAFEGFQDVCFSIQTTDVGEGRFVLIAYKLLPVSFAIILQIVYNPDTNQLKKDLFWVVFIPPLAFVLLLSEWLRQCQSQIKIKLAVLL